jgi:tRNA(Ile)-lysidine synthase
VRKLNLSVQAADRRNALNGLFNGLTGLPRVAVAVSGGSDSMALLRLVVDWSRSQHGPREVYALTVDHGLRDGSGTEAAQVARWCERLQLPHVTLPWVGEKPQTGIQAKARAARYDLLAQWCRKNAVPIFMTGHTADDQAETVFMRQQRTNSPKSLAGIWPENEWLGVRVLRPLLTTHRETLRSYLRDLEQFWLEDPSNDNPRFERVRVRQALAGMPVENLQDIAAASQKVVREDNHLAKTWLAIHLYTDVYGVVRVTRKALRDERLAVRHLVVGHALQIAGDGTVPDAAGVEAASDWLQSGALGRRSLNGAVINVRQNVVEIMREPGRLRARWTEVPADGHVVFDGRFHVVAPKGSFVGPMGQPPLVKRFKDVPALAFSALPAVKFADGKVFSAVNSSRIDISATLCERFSL